MHATNKGQGVTVNKAHLFTQPEQQSVIRIALKFHKAHYSNSSHTIIGDLEGVEHALCM